jgi:cystathionine beta-lyase
LQCAKSGITLIEMSTIHIPPLVQLRERLSEKWRRFPADVLPLPVAEMDYEIAPAIRQRLIDMVDRSDTGYLGPMPELGQALHDFSKDRWGFDFDPERVRIAVDVGAAIVEVSRLFINPGEKILINSPVYQNFYNWIKELHAECVDAPLVEVTVESESESESESGRVKSYRLDFDAIESGYASGAKIHFLCHPHNPLGVIFTASDLARIADLAEKYGVLVISDEIHSPLVYPGEQYVPFLAVSASARAVGISVISASKAWNLAGLKCAQFLTLDDGLNERLKSLPEAVHFRGSLFGAVAAVAAFAESRDWLDEVRTDLMEKFNRLDLLLERELPEAILFHSHFGYLGWIDLRSYGLGDEPAKELLNRGRVALNPGHTYGPGGKGFVRFNFGTSDEIIEEAVSRMKHVLI